MIALDTDIEDSIDVSALCRYDLDVASDTDVEEYIDMLRRDRIHSISFTIPIQKSISICYDLCRCGYDIGHDADIEVDMDRLHCMSV